MQNSITWILGHRFNYMLTYIISLFIIFLYGLINIVYYLLHIVPSIYYNIGPTIISLFCNFSKQCCPLNVSGEYMDTQSIFFFLV